MWLDGLKHFGFLEREGQQYKTGLPPKTSGSLLNFPDLSTPPRISRSPVLNSLIPVDLFFKKKKSDKVS